MAHRMAAVCVLAAAWLLAGCNNCEALAESVCEEIGPDDCALWKEAKGPESLSTGRRSGRACFNMRFMPGGSSPIVTGAKATAEAMRKAKVKQEARKKAIAR
jgi:hypothetical protein